MFVNALFKGALLTVCTTIRAYVIVTFFISQSLFRCIVLLLVFLMDWEEMVYFCALLFFSYVKKILSIYSLQSYLQWKICRMKHLMKVAIWQRSVTWLQDLLPQLSFGKLVTPLKETVWLSPTSQEVSVANTDALQTTLVEGCLRRCSLMYCVRIYTIHLFLLFVFSRHSDVFFFNP